MPNNHLAYRMLDLENELILFSDTVAQEAVGGPVAMEVRNEILSRVTKLAADLDSAALVVAAFEAIPAGEFERLAPVIRLLMKEP